MLKFKINLHLFEGDGAGAAAGTGGEGGGEAAVTPGVLEDGTEVDNRLAARLEQQAKRRKARGEQDVVLPMQQQGAQTQETPEAEPEKSLDDEWDELRNGKFKDLYGRDVKNAIQDRFKNQKNAADELEKLQPMLRALEKLHGINEGDTETLSKTILDDDSLYEEAADEAGMTVEGYKAMQQVLAENERLKKQEQQAQEDYEQQQHFKHLWGEAEELRKTYPNFDLMEELKNPTFFRLTLPNSGLSVSDAFYAVHHQELESQAMAYGIQRTQKQISQTLQANRQRPSEGAMQGSQRAQVSVDPRSMTREQRQKLIERARRGEDVVF